MAAAQQFPFFQFNAAYLTALRKHDAATEAHFESYFCGLLQRKLRHRLRRSDEISEVQQETMLRVLTAVHSAGGVRRPECFGAFVFAVCENVLREFGRSRKRYQPLDEKMADRLVDSEGPEGLVCALEAKATVDRTLARLSPWHRNLLRAVYLTEGDKAKICRKMKITRNHLRVLLFRAKQEFLAQHRRLALAASRRAVNS